MQRTSVRNFDPTTVAKLETEMWHAYYHHNFIRLLLVLRKLTSRFAGLSFTRSLWASYYATTAAASFRCSRGEEDAGKITRKLERFYELVKKESGESFSATTVAKAELDWWLVDRYPDKYEISRRDAIARTLGLIYGIDPVRLGKYADFRANAMEIQDEAEKIDQEADWRRIEQNLREAYKYLRAAV